MIIFMGQYAAAEARARQFGLAPSQYKIACDFHAAERALMGVDPDTTTVEFVYGSHHVVTPAVMARIRILDAVRRTPEEVMLGELGIDPAAEGEPAFTGRALLVGMVALFLLFWVGLPLAIVVFG